MRFWLRRRRRRVRVDVPGHLIKDDHSGYNPAIRPSSRAPAARGSAPLYTTDSPEISDDCGERRRRRLIGESVFSSAKSSAGLTARGVLYGATFPRCICLVQFPPCSARRGMSGTIGKLIQEYEAVSPGACGPIGCWASHRPLIAGGKLRTTGSHGNEEKRAQGTGRRENGMSKQKIT